MVKNLIFLQVVHRRLEFLANFEAATAEENDKITSAFLLILNFKVECLISGEEEAA